MKRLYGSGLRLIEGLRLRVKAVAFTQKQVLVRDGKGSKSRISKHECRQCRKEAFSAESCANLSKLRFAQN